MKDFLGNPISVGDKIIVAMREGNQAYLRIARVTGFGIRGADPDYGGGDPTVEVDWLIADGWHRGGDYAREGKPGYIFQKRAGSVLKYEADA